ncbi:MAG: hypothetical protein AAFQ87_21730, partial [Bacteroidota bacterium]
MLKNLRVSGIEIEDVYLKMNRSPKDHMKYSLLLLSLLISSGLVAQVSQDNWHIRDHHSIVWHPEQASSLPYQDNIEMAGKQVAAILYYSVDEDHNLRIEKDLIFPQLRTFNKSNEPDWKKYRAYFRRKVGDELAPIINIGETTIIPSKVDSIVIGGMIEF